MRRGEGDSEWHVTAAWSKPERELRARNITYCAVAKRLGMSEASVKRMFSQREFSALAIDAICEVAGMEFSRPGALARRRPTR